MFMPRAPDQQLQKNGRQIDSFFRQPVMHPASIALVDLRSDDSACFQLAQAIRQNVRGDPFARFLELLKCPESAHHQVADDQQRPAISKPLERDAHRTARSPFGPYLPSHAAHNINVTCKSQVIGGTLSCSKSHDFTPIVFRCSTSQTGYSRFRDSAIAF